MIKAMKHLNRALLLCTCVTLVSGCNLVGSIVARSMERSAKRTQQADRTPSQVLAQQLTPLESGPGLVVCEPKSSPADSAFARGCGRWLFLQCSGQGEFGQSPGWGVVDEVRRQMGEKSLQLDKKSAVQLIKFAGATYSAVGKLEGSGARQKLTYQLWKIDGTAWGTPLSIEGSRDEITRQLLALARKICVQLGAQNSTVAACELTADELSLIGKAVWKPRRWLPVSDPTIVALRKLAPRSPLATVLLARGTAIKEAEAALLQQSLIQKAGSNVLVINEFSRFWWGKTRIHEKPLQTLLAKHPRHNLLHDAQSRFHKAKGMASRTLARQSAEMAVRCAPRSYITWYKLSEVLQEQAEDTRGGRFYSAMSPREARQIEALYPLSLEAAQKSAALNPQNSYSWKQVAVTATFYGAENLADQAMTKALKLDPLNDEAYGWAFQMYQPKWGANRAKVVQYGQQAAAKAGQMDVPTKSLLQAYRAFKMDDQIEPTLQKLVQANPLDAVALYEYGSIHHYQKRDYAKAEAFYRRAIAIEPRYARCLSSLGDLQYWVHGNQTASEKYYRQAIAADPSDGFHHANLARLMNNTGRRQRAMTEIATARQLGFRKSHPVWDELGVCP